MLNIIVLQQLIKQVFALLPCLAEVYNVFYNKQHFLKRSLASYFVYHFNMIDTISTGNIAIRACKAVFIIMLVFYSLPIAIKVEELKKLKNKSRYDEV